MGYYRKGIIVILVLLLALLAGCASTPTAQEAPTIAPTAGSASAATSVPTIEPAKPTATTIVSNKASDTLEEGWTLVEKKADGFAVALPPKWGQIDPDPNLWDVSIKEIVAKNPDMSFALTNQAKSFKAQGAKFYGFDLSSDSLGSSYAANINVMVQTLPSTTSLGDYGTAVWDQLRKQLTKGTDVKQLWVTTAAGNALEFTFSIPTQPNEKTVKLSFTQYHYLKGNQAFILSCTTDKPDKYNVLFEKIGQRFRLID